MPHSDIMTTGTGVEPGTACSQEYFDRPGERGAKIYLDRPRLPSYRPALWLRKRRPRLQIIHSLPGPGGYSLASSTPLFNPDSGLHLKGT